MFDDSPAGKPSNERFEYRETQATNKKKRARIDEVSEKGSSDGHWLLGNDESSNREFKVRIVERLTFLEHKLNGSQQCAPSKVSNKELLY
jgi:hypothetical protein